MTNAAPIAASLLPQPELDAIMRQAERNTKTYATKENAQRAFEGHDAAGGLPIAVQRRSDDRWAIVCWGCGPDDIQRAVNAIWAGSPAGYMGRQSDLPTG
jgi:hypothetical protein